ncbi:tol-pal system-associated acyl-CoA thioesterase [Novilysobacter defluvii]|uniref:Acyl-CoA thioester hydrolase n=1 Tax=Lysobacter defluvii IMMIB APB-9 = DSM 18482 TaxID=1385515 RepID=A0A0A0M804_9GAMM|nr:tol-pal system-associated acyl-CoA thioesterase [Lysobacter defluvii]KGO98339.1 acyl-CoA thioester hydrolase [Lysobacter defluvii IMMIB APB-9 = DSM 18482]
MFSLPLRIYWEDTDAGGVVYHAQYLAFMERARSEWMRAQRFGQELLRREHGLQFVVRSMEIDFRRAARLDDLLGVGCSLVECRRASAVFHQVVRRGQEVLVTAKVRVAAVDVEGFRPVAITEPLLEALRARVEPAPQA